MAPSSFAFADADYSCTSVDAGDIGLPMSLYVELEGNSVSLQDSKTDIYYTGQIASVNSNGDQVATGFKDLISDGSVIVGKDLLNGSDKGELTIVDMALDSVETKYSCELSK